MLKLQEHRSPPSATVWRLVDEMAALTLAEAAELSLIMRRLSMKEDVVVGVMKPGAAGIESFDAASKLKVIKEIQSFTDLGLKEAKELVEKSPAVLKKGVPKQEAEQIIEKMKAVGAKLVME
ncbi:hypothetical protein SASPL_142023 [Salvia splendens]|uniref:Large ribosomal subunit protein bL12 C-terminal domain-containing protein n=1 Tax=Salvia splendens TaxID=180675 RepID=A0A8X8WJG5_SALSN|nr:hypothetical protein SASPL_142023 [Salvia splendens]